MTTSYLERLQAATASYGPLCVGIDPSRKILAQWGLDYKVEGLERCAQTMVEAMAGIVPVVKPQSAFFEAFGSAGVAVLERTCAAAQAAGLLVILDVKRGDIGSTMDAYAEAYLTNDSPFAVDAITVSPYPGFYALQPAIDAAHASGRGIYVLARTSNPEGTGAQQAVRADGRTVTQSIVDDAIEVNAGSGQGAIGLVVGATREDTGCDLTRFNASILAPGIGAQGGRMDELSATFGAQAPLVLASASRQVLSGGPRVPDIRDRALSLLG